MNGLAATAQQRRIARAQAECSRIGGNIGTAFVNNADQPDRDAAAHQCHAGRRGRTVDFFSDRIRQGGHVLDCGRYALQTGAVELQPVEHRSRKAARLSGADILGVGSQDSFLCRADCCGSGDKGGRFFRITCAGQLPLRRAALCGQISYECFRSGELCALVIHGRALPSRQVPVRAEFKSASNRQQAIWFPKM